MTREMDQTAIPCSVMRGGTSKGLYFLAKDLPADRERRDAVLLAAMGAPDPREIDGMGGGHPLTSKVAIVSPSAHPEADIEYLFVQVRTQIVPKAGLHSLMRGETYIPASVWTRP